ncbi:ABC transporter permease [Gaetbulibacter aestuarii]
MLFTILFGIANGLDNNFQKRFIQRSENAITFYTGTTSKPYKGYQIGRQIFYYNDDARYIKKEFPNDIQYISGTLRRNYNISYKEKKGEYSVMGIDPDYQFLQKAKILKGRFINDRDILNRSKYIIIGRLVESDLFGKESALGKYVNLEGVAYRVVGVYSDDGGDSQERIIYAPLTTIQKLYTGDNKLGTIMVGYKPDLSVDQTIALVNRIKSKLKNKNSVAPDDQRAIRASDRILTEKKRQDNFSLSLRILIPIIGFGTLIAGILGISNIMIFIVKERTKEIGIRKALGATPRSIVSIILLETILITTITGYLGLVIGVSILKGIGPSLERYFILDPGVNISIVFTATIVLIIAGGIAGFIPAKRASKIKPIVALRND